MRRASALLVIPLLAAAAALAGCGSSSSSSSSATSSSSASSSSGASSSGASQSVKVTGNFGTAPTVSVPKAKAGASLYSHTVIQGTGAKLTTSLSLVGNFVLYDWSGTTNKLVASTYTGGNGPTLLSGQMLPGLSTALEGQKVGSRILAVLPPSQGFGAQGNSQVGIAPTDTLVYVIDMVAAVGNTQGVTGTQSTNGGGTLPTVTEAPGQAAVVKVPKTAPPKTLVVKPLLVGKGAKIVNGDYVVVQYTGVIYKSGKVFDSSWSRKQPFAFSVGAMQVIPGWDKGMVGQTVGSRVMLLIPPADGYGSAGASQAGITGTDTLVFVVDIVASYKPTPK
jgi:FKBP-type peptidyl-prolyl cis-trans isomerase